MARYIEATKCAEIISEKLGIRLFDLVDVFAEIPSADVVPKSEVERLTVELKAMRGAANSLKMHYEKAKAEVERLHGILLQFTDIVHKWGAKNNIDTSEISLVPILQEEADSIIKKSNQELAREIFAEIEKLKHTKFDWSDVVDWDGITKLKKKYTEGEPIPATEEKYFSPEDVSKMTPQEVREKYTAIRKSMERW